MQHFFHLFLAKLSPVRKSKVKIKQKRLLQCIFSAKGNFTPGISAPRRMYDGVEIAPFFNNCNAAVSISADFELNWAFRSRRCEERNHLGATERHNVPFILDLLAEFAVPITWATVGHLFLTSCVCDGKYAHPKMPRPPLNRRWRGDWYKHDPCTDMLRDPLWYAPDLIERIIQAKVSHEVGSHSFSHVDFSPQTSNRELIRREMEEVLAVMAPLGLRLRSLVYPFNSMGHSYQDLLHQFGIIAVRHRDDKVRLSYPERTACGVYKIYESMNLRSPNLYNYRDKAELFIAHAIQYGAAYHLWFHPSDPRTLFQKEFCEILQLIQRQREAGKVWVVTMGDLAAYCEARERISIKSKRDQERTTLQIRSSLNTDRYGVPVVTLLVPATKVPKRIEQRIDATCEQRRPDSMCTKKNGTLMLNVPAATQTVVLFF